MQNLQPGPGAFSPHFLCPIYNSLQVLKFFCRQKKTPLVPIGTRGVCVVCQKLQRLRLSKQVASRHAVGFGNMPRGSHVNQKAVRVCAAGETHVAGARHRWPPAPRLIKFADGIDCALFEREVLSRCCKHCLGRFGRFGRYGLRHHLVPLFPRCVVCERVCMCRAFTASRSPIPRAETCARPRHRDA